MRQGRTRTEKVRDAVSNIRRAGRRADAAGVTEFVRADELRTVEDGHRKEWEVEGVTMEIAVEPVAAAEASD
ncbi:hypothetical protein [Natronococcus occultus]|uniref:hypothetical protein n=1 Tax=Natronococcus occultus TaxID=29288 RepID=UPI000677BB4C|nr:hypothetical protein [Natronococcus occultus]